MSRKTAAIILVLGLSMFPMLGRQTVVARASTMTATSPNLHLYHDGWDPAYRDPFGAVPSGAKLTLRFRTALSVSKAWVYLLPSSGSTKRDPMTRSHRNATSQVWSITMVAPSVPGAWHYYFGAQAAKTTEWYGDASTVAGSGPGQTYVRQGSVNPYELTVYLNSFRTPSWMNNAVIYQIFPDRFFDGDKSNDPKTGTEHAYITTYFHKNWSEKPFDSAPYSTDFFGGDLQGVIDKLPYLHSLGVNVIYLNPIFLAPSDHKYDVSNFFEIDPEFGTMATFKSLVSKAGMLGMHIMLDGEFNTTGSDSVYFNRYGTFSDVGAYQSQSSKYFPWYTFYSWPDNYQAFEGIDTLPQLTEVPAVQNFIFRQPGSVAQYWLKQGASGWRPDHVVGKSHAWWQNFRRSIKASYPQADLTGEIFQVEGGQALQDPVSWLLGNELDGTTNYPFRDDVLNFFANGTGADEPNPLTAGQFLTAEMGLLSEYPRPAALASMNLIDSHDTERILNDLSFNIQALRLVALYQMTWLGAPAVFYGDETGITGADNNLGRATFPWSHQNASLETYYSGLIHMRHAHAALSTGSVTPLFSSNGQRVVAYLRQAGREAILVILNDSGKSQTATIPIPQLANGTVLTGISPGLHGRVTIAKGSARVTVGKLSGQVFQAKVK